jgi:hypothetical protein
MSDQEKPHIDETEMLAEARHRSGQRLVPLRIPLLQRFKSLVNPHYDGPPSWLWYTGIARLIMLVVVATGTLQVQIQIISIGVLSAIFLAAMACSIWYLMTLHRGKMSPLH